MYGYIYETTNLINGKKYIGQKKSSFFVEDYFGSGILISQAIKKYGVENFSVRILKECDSKEDLNKSEIFFIKEANAAKSKLYYNIAGGGEGGDTYAGKSEEELNIIKHKISIKNSGLNNGNKGQYVGHLNSMYGKKHSLESRIKTSESLKKLNINRSHKWTPDMNAKRNNTCERYSYLWAVKNTNTCEIIYNFSGKIVFIKSIYPDIYKKISKLDRLTLKRDGVLKVDNIIINRKLIDTYNTPESRLNIYKKYHDEWKLFIYERRKEYLRKLRNNQGVSTIENTI